jgi:peptidoglycan/xylan/chitin deacetylase (PgdA/CDA1 family)
MSRLKQYGLSILGPFADTVPISWLIKATGQKLFLPFYHIVSDEDVPHAKHLYPVRTVKQFEADLEVLLKYYHPVGIEELIQWANNGRQIRENSFFLSFDDGLREMYDIVAPILERKGIPAAFFVNSAFADNKDLFFRYKASLLIDTMLKEAVNEEQAFQAKRLLTLKYPSTDTLGILAKAFDVSFEEYLREKQPYMSTEQLHHLKSRGFHIGAHSVDHPLYSDISLHEQLMQTAESLQWLLEKELSSYNLFAFPFTDHGVSKAFFNTIYDPSAPIADLTFGTAGLKQNTYPRHYQRFPMEGTMQSAQQLIATEYLYYLLKMPLGKNRIVRS